MAFPVLPVTTASSLSLKLSDLPFKEKFEWNSFAQMKTGVRLLNCSRGEVVHLEDLIAAIESGTVAGAALDVFPKEPPPADMAILQHRHQSKPNGAFRLEEAAQYCIRPTG
jgi:D-3-phosphoglycerate dehydrogenase